MWHKSITDTINQAKEREMCLYGAGFWGEIAYRIFTKMGCNPVCFCDDAPEKCRQKYQDLPVYSLEEAVERYPNAVYLVCIDVEKRVGTWNRDGFTNMIRNLKKYGVYDSNSELRIPLYLYLLDLANVNDMDIVENREELICAEEIQNVVIFNHMSNSGSFYLEQLLDGHPDILTLPYSTHVFGLVYEHRLKYLEGTELLIEMGAQMFGYFHSAYGHLSCVKNNKFALIMDEKGQFMDDVLIHPDDFMRQLQIQFAGRKISLTSFGDMMKIYAAAYNNCLGRKKRDTSYWLFYHMHKTNYDVADTYEYFHKDEFSRIENLIIIREPVQQCYSYVRRMIIKGKDNIILTKDADFIHTIKCEMGLNLEKRKGIDCVKVIRFEDLKFRSEETMRSLCDWMKIPYSDILSSTTTNGYEVYFPVFTADGVKYITGNDTTTVGEKNFSEALTVWDEARLNMIYSKFKKAYGYENDVPEFTEFDEAALEQILQKDFKFASIAQEVLDEYGRPEDKYDINEFIKKMYAEYMRGYKEETEYYDYIRPVADEG